MHSLSFSNAVKSSNVFQFSPNGEMIAYAKGSYVFVNNLPNFKQIVKYSLIDVIDSIEWSNDSTQILIGIYSRNICEVKSLTNPSLNFKINEGLFGMNYARFVPNNLNILTLNHFNMRLVIWSIEDKNSIFIIGPKFSNKGLEFTSDGVFLALAEIKHGSDYLGIYNTHDWTIICVFQTITSDLQDIKWTSDNKNVIVWDTYIECRFVMYSAMDGHIISIVEPYQFELGIRNLNISPNGQFIAIGCFDNSIKTYKCLNECEMIDNFEHGQLHIDDKVHYLQETISFDEDGNEKILLKTLYPPIKLEVNETLKELPSNSLPVKGIKSHEWSHDSNYLASKDENIPNILWIWKMTTSTLHCLIIFSTSITTFKWSPNDLILIIGCKNPYVYVYDITRVLIHSLPSNILFIDTIIWNEGERDSLVLSNQSELIVCEMKTILSKSVSTFIKDF